MMSNISMVEAKLPPGFRFHPRDEELISDYLMKKVTTDHHHHHHDHFDFESPPLIEVDLNKSEPWDIPETACVGGKDWYFYSQRDRKYATGLRTNRATATGYWKATGKDRPVLRKGSLIGMRKTLVFYQGRAPKGRKTDWVMHEFRLEGQFGPPKTLTEDWVLCRVFHKSKDSSEKSTMGTSSYYEEDTSSLSLPPLTDHSYLNFNTTNHNPVDFEQVPCFSIFSQTQPSPNHNNNMTFSSQFTDMDHQFPVNPTMGSEAMAETGDLDLDPLGSGKKVIKAVLDQYFTKIDSNMYSGAMRGSSASCFGGGGEEEGSSESFLSEMGLPNILNLY